MYDLTLNALEFSNHQDTVSHVEVKNLLILNYIDISQSAKLKLECSGSSPQLGADKYDRGSTHVKYILCRYCIAMTNSKSTFYADIALP